MSILDYFFYGICFTMFIDIMLWICKDHPQVSKVYHTWGYGQRFWCALLWPLTSIFFLFSIIKAMFKK